MAEKKEFVVGIDLGTTNSVIAWMKPDGTVEVIPNAEGSRVTPSVVAFTKSGEILVGEPAKRQMILNPERTIKSIKRKMGTDYKVRIDDKEYTPQEISAFILKKLKNDAEAYLGGEIKKAVITCPAYFNDAQRQATKEAGIIAGLEVLRIINEPTAAALAYGLDKAGKEEKVLVYDLGGGTFDVSILEIGEGVIEVIATAGNNHLGGDDFDQRLIDWMAEEFKKQHGIDLREDRQALQRLRDAAEKAKIELSTKMETDVSLPFIAVSPSGQPLHLEMRITRSLFESLTRDLVEMTRGPIEQALNDAKLSPQDIDEIILVGGMTRVPMVQRFIKEFFGKEPNKSVNPDEAVAIGAAIQAAILAGTEGAKGRDIVLVDVTPLTLGIEVKGGLFEPIIPRNTKIPVRKSKIFTTVEDGQTEVEIRVYQGERPIARENIFLGSFKLVGIPPAPRGVPQIEVTFDIDSDGIVHVSAKDLGSGKEQSMVVTGRHKLSEDEIKRMIEDAKRYEEQDKRLKEEIELKNRADDLAYSVEKTLKEHGDKIPADLKSRLEDMIRELRDAINRNDIPKVKMLFDDLQKESMKIGEYLYKSATGGETSNQ
ncbi:MULTISPECIES: molecular chaperone DnaK [Thermotoga]|jgi:molecular chaperone DnaK|uniref:Chaperone protein DnaK n=4 Tax=Thermotoga TaxID=2335 RepID=DNAK_THEMA|nr:MULTISPECIES: molecular chaperone DnaK [Thermotoga]A5IK42.1 RecName: Full=Chaperone protein DnaK; AltName: Full=HSP70; AltName: Full=Heat shock 70 kDa protein; AltName: Full=Heat shock protein 70 [Thermotoga petrophila RKU-1]B1L9B4.1 RecName: Full=Chaperone protein DnaK; AltName: Full=HSP70; AltName: Full=Heat shock 70 kDa protein; AltName: Full=Heat shock protein 70 [Thermotoga sp. RQ2]Q9WYK6.1 RecName: Full=Chaperone protein DnaK; AltName: Full=HSP70; AltName: Full=Heat shock 70 kDa protein